MVDLGLCENDLLNLSIIEFNELVDRYETNQALEDYRFGVLASVLVSVNTTKHSKKYTPDYFFPTLKRFTKGKEMTTDEQSLSIKEHLKTLLKPKRV